MMTVSTGRGHRRVAFAAAMVMLLWQAVGFVQSPGDWTMLDARAGELYVQGDLAGAIEVSKAALQAAATPGESGRSLGRLGFFVYTSGDPGQGEKYLRQALQIRESAFGAGSLEYAESANDLALLLRDSHRIPEAKTFAERAVAIRARLLPADDSLLAESLNTHGSVLAFGGEYAAAVTPMERAVGIHESHAESRRSSEEYGTLCVNLASTFHRLGRYATADATFEKGLAVLRVKPGLDHPVYAASALAHAALKVDLGRYVEAERLYDDAGRRLRVALTEQHPLYATFLNNRGFLFQSIGNATAAEADYRQSLALKKQQKAAAVSVASTLRNLAHLIYPRDRAESERLLVEAADAYAGLATPPSFDYTSVLVGLARAQRDRGAFADARSTLERAVEMSRRGLGARHPLHAAAVRDLGLVHLASGETALAQRHLDDALAIAEGAHNPMHPDLASFLDSLAAFHAQRGAPAAALALYRRSVAIREQFLGDVLEIGSESFKTSSMAALADSSAALIAFQAKAAAAAPDARVLAFEVATRQKGRVLETVRNWRHRLRGVSNDAVQRQLAEWQALLECRTSLTLALGYRDLKPAVVGGCSLEGTGLSGRYERLLSDLRSARTEEVGTQAVAAITTLRERGDVLEASLNRTAGEPGSRRNVTAEAIRSRLAPDELLIEFVSYQPQESGTGGARRYGAFVLDSVGALEWIDIGPASPIDSSVRAVLDAANDWSLSVRNNEGLALRAAEITAQDALDELSKRVWAPLQPAVNARRNVRRLRISPDASLNLVPFEAISDGRDLIERFAITYLPAGRDLMDDDGNQPSTAPLVVVSPGASISATRARQGTLRADVLAYLAEAAGEAADFRRVVAGATLYSVADATERHLKGVQGPALLHIVGHGIVVGQQDCADAACAPAAFDRSANAMALSAIVLEEAYGRVKGSPDDGMMTPLELQNVDLRGTEMLVLSQCQMANGVVSVGEGVYGMRRAAAVAGAKTFVAPLWNVDDRVQRTLMARFYRSLAQGETRGDALREAKLAVRRTPATRSFLHWAPVILSGAATALPPALFR